jgi:hypothetical protein
LRGILRSQQVRRQGRRSSIELGSMADCFAPDRPRCLAQGECSHVRTYVRYSGSVCRAVSGIKPYGPPAARSASDGAGSHRQPRAGTKVSQVRRPRSLPGNESGTSMELAFRTKRLRTVCEDHAKAIDAYGAPAADALRTRLADLRAVTFLAELPAGLPQVTEGDPPFLRFRLRDGWVVVASVSHHNTPRSPDGSLDLTRVRRALIIDILR